MTTTIHSMMTTDSTNAAPGTRTLVLASGSPRRRAMLEDAGVPFMVRPASIDDGELDPPPGADPASWVMALAHLKARSSLDACAHELGQDAVVLGADTVCVRSGRVIGQPRSGDDAREIIRAMRDATHEVLTGVAILGSRERVRDLFVDRSVVTLGAIHDDEIDRYINTGAWEGKAGAYNIGERLSAGWPIEFVGSADSIAGLPLARVLARLDDMRLNGAA